MITDEEPVMHSNSDNIEIMIYDKAYGVIQELFWWVLSRYWTALEETLFANIFYKHS